MGPRPGAPRAGPTRRCRACVPTGGPAGPPRRGPAHRVAGPGEHGHLAAEPGRCRGRRPRDPAGRCPGPRLGPRPGRVAGRARLPAHRSPRRGLGRLRRGPAATAGLRGRCQRGASAGQPGNAPRVPGSLRRGAQRPGRVRTPGHRPGAVAPGGHGRPQPRLHRGPSGRCARRPRRLRPRRVGLRRVGRPPSTDRSPGLGPV